MLDWLDDAVRVVPLLWVWKSYVVALWHTLRHPVTLPVDICKRPRSCRRSHRLAMVLRKGKPGYFVLVH
jgi:hypothetical protein